VTIFPTALALMLLQRGSELLLARVNTAWLLRQSHVRDGDAVGIEVLNRRRRR
jgi:hypothetical protein